VFFNIQKKYLYVYSRMNKFYIENYFLRLEIQKDFINQRSELDH